MTKEAKQAYLLARIAIGTTFFGHGIARLLVLDNFSKWMVEQFAKSNLPAEMVHIFSYVLPFLELTIGLLVLIGLFTRQAYIVGGIIMISLILGSTSIHQLEAIPSQLLHTAFLVLLLIFERMYNSYKVDGMIARNHKAAEW